MLFERNNMTDGTQVTVPRYLQEGSIIVNVSEGVFEGAAETVYTVSTGKKLYVTDVTVQIVSSNTSADDYGFLKDGSAGDTKVVIEARSYTGGEVINFNFATPIVFTDSIYWVIGAPGAVMSANLTISGWEEDA